MKIPFKIDHIDPLGQGVSKLTDKVTFIPKVLPEEKGNCQVYATKSKVQFAELIEITEPSPLRIEPSCPHFNQCPSCHYLHVDYDQEINLKESALKQQIGRMLKNAGDFSLTTHTAPKRNAYRNRIQLHYDKKRNLLGQFSRAQKEIIPIPECTIALPSVANELKRLYQNSQWQKLVEKAPNRGHIEIYETDQGVKLSVNEDYAAGGFTQVFSQMNTLALDLLSKRFHQDFSEGTTILDLFGGKGNLTRNFSNSPSLVVDATEYGASEFATHQEYFRLNLYSKNALPTLHDKLKQKEYKLLILDPPRSGFKELDQLLDCFNPQFLYYMSCQSDTALRDIAKCHNYLLEEIHLLDFFPSTYHFETLFFLRKIL